MCQRCSGARALAGSDERHHYQGCMFATQCCYIGVFCFSKKLRFFAYTRSHSTSWPCRAGRVPQAFYSDLHTVRGHWIDRLRQLADLAAGCSGAAFVG